MILHFFCHEFTINYKIQPLYHEVQDKFDAALKNVTHYQLCGSPNMRGR